MSNTSIDTINLVALANYQHEETILRFTDAFALSEEEAEDVFHEMKKLLALMVRYPEEYVFTHEPLWVLDEMWHTFLMYTADYADFCQRYFGRMVHHAPIDRTQKLQVRQALEDENEAVVADVSAAVRRLYELIYEYLGKDTLVKWIHGYGNKYTLAYMNEVRKPIV